MYVLSMGCTLQGAYATATLGEGNEVFVQTFTTFSGT